MLKIERGNKPDVVMVNMTVDQAKTLSYVASCAATGVKPDLGKEEQEFFLRIVEKIGDVLQW